VRKNRAARRELFAASKSKVRVCSNSSEGYDAGFRVGRKTEERVPRGDKAAGETQHHQNLVDYTTQLTNA
jgi:hypothetical protein